MKMKKTLALLLAVVMLVLNGVSFAVKFDITHKTDANKNTSLYELSQDYDLVMEVFGASQDYEIEYENGLRYNLIDVLNYLKAHPNTPINIVFQNIQPINQEPTVELEVIDISKINKSSITVGFNEAAKNIANATIIIEKGGKAVEVTPVAIAAGAASATFDFVTPFNSYANLAGEWSVKGKNQAEAVTKNVVLPQASEATATAVKTVLVKFDMELDSATAANFKIVPSEDGVEAFAAATATIKNDNDGKPKNIELTWTTGDLGAAPKLQLMEEAVVSKLGVGNIETVQNLMISVDSIKPALQTAAYDMDTNRLALTFSKEVEANIDLTKVRINAIALTGTATKEGNVLTLQLEDSVREKIVADMLKNKRLMLNMSAGAVSTTGNTLLKNSAANMELTSVTSTPEWTPGVSSYNEETRTLKLAFLQVATVADITKISVGKAEGSLTALTDAVTVTPDTANQYALNIVLNADAAEAIGGLESGKELYVKVAAGAVRTADNKNNKLDATEKVDYRADKVKPELVSAAYDKASNKLILTFSKEVETGIDLKKVMINNIEVGMGTVTKEEKVLTIQMNPVVKLRIQAFINQQADLTLNLEAGAVSRADKPTLKNDRASVALTVNFTPEWNPNDSSYDSITRTLKLVFTEEVTVADITKISVGRTEASLTALTAGATATRDTENAKMINIVLSPEVAETLRGLKSGKTLYVKVAAEAVKNANDVKNTQDVTEKIDYVADVVGPNLVSASFESGFNELMLTFSEEIRNVDSIEAGKIIFLIGEERVASVAEDFNADVNVAGKVLTVSMKDSTPNADGSTLDKLAAAYDANKTIKVLLAEGFVQDFAGTSDTAGNNSNAATEEGIVLNYESLTIPETKSVATISKNRIKVTFTTPMNKETVNPSNISIVDLRGKAVEVNAVFAEDNLKVFHVQTATDLRYASAGKAYTMTLRNMKSKSEVNMPETTKQFDGNKTASDTEAPVIERASFNAVQGYNNDVITVVFQDENPIKEETVKSKENYTLMQGDAAVEGFNVRELVYEPGTKTATLTVEGVNLDANATNYKIKVVGVADFYNNVNANGITKELQNESTDRQFVKDNITGATTSETNVITLTFSEELDQVSATAVANYMVVLDQETAPTSAAIAANGKIVTLTMAEGVKFTGANVTVKLQAGLKDAALNALGEVKDIDVPVTDATKPGFAAENPIVAVANTMSTGDTIVLTFSENVTDNEALKNKENYEVKIGEDTVPASAIRSVEVTSGNKVTITLEPSEKNFIKGNIITVKILANTLTDVSNNTNTEVLTASAAATAANTGLQVATFKLLTQKTALVTFQNGLDKDTVEATDFAIENVVITEATAGEGDKANEVTLTFQENVTAGAPVVLKAGANFAITDDLGNQLTNVVLGEENGISSSNKVVVIGDAQDFTVAYDGAEDTQEAYHFKVTAHVGEEISTNGTTWEDATGQEQKVMIAKDGATITVRVKRPVIGVGDIVVEGTPKTRVITKPNAPENVGYTGEFNAIQLTNANGEMEYTLDEGMNWTTVGAETIAITAQQSLKIRVKATPSSVPSEIVEIIGADTTLPALTTVVATANADDIPDTIVLTFSEKLKNTAELSQKGSYKITVGLQELEAEDIADPVFNNLDKVTIDLVPARRHLYKGEQVKVEVLQGKVQDLRGNTNAEILTLTEGAVAATGANNTAATAEIITNLKTLKLTFATKLLSGSVEKEDFVVDGNVVERAELGVGEQANEVTLTFQNDLAKGSIAVKPSGSFEIKDTMGNVLDRSVLNGDTGLTVKTEADAPSKPVMSIESTDAQGGKFRYSFVAGEGYEYKVSKGSAVVTNWTDATPGKVVIEVDEDTAEDYTIVIRVKATATLHESTASEAATIAKAAAAPSVSKAPDSDPGQVKLVGADQSMQFSKDNGQTWEDFTQGQIDGTETFAESIVVRVKATNESVASQKTQPITP